MYGCERHVDILQWLFIYFSDFILTVLLDSTFWFCFPVLFSVAVFIFSDSRFYRNIFLACCIENMRNR